MLSLATGILRSDLVAIDALYRQAFVFFLGSKLDKRRLPRVSYLLFERQDPVTLTCTSSNGGAGRFEPGVDFFEDCVVLGVCKTCSGLFIGVPDDGPCRVGVCDII
jgi:hypothetical protein